MDALTLGPLMLPYDRLPGLIALLLLLLGSELLSRRYPHINRWAWLTLLAAVAGGRLVYALAVPDAYLAQPLSFFYFWQPGYHFWGAALGALLPTCFYAWRYQALRRLVPGFWLLLCVSVLLLDNLLPRQTPPAGLPDFSVTTLAGEVRSLDSLHQGRPLLINLWATWCPPCRREMPVLAVFDQDERLDVVLLNQGESLLAVSEYLQDQQLDFRHSLLDAQQQAMGFYQAPGLPITLFYDAEGQLVNRHIGEISRAQIEAFLQRP